MKTTIFLSALATGALLLSSSVMRSNRTKITAKEAANRIVGRANRTGSNKVQSSANEWTGSHQLAS